MPEINILYLISYYCSKNLLNNNKLQYGMYRLVEANVRPIIYNAL